ncbi:hypothetical protein Hanom_Chr09g00798731 [Helianthus anomalus]
MNIVGFLGLFRIFCGAAVGTVVDLPELELWLFEIGLSGIGCR